MVICLEQGADLHMAQLTPLPLTVSCFSKIQIGFTFLVPAHPGSPGKRAVKRVCVCACVRACACVWKIQNVIAVVHDFITALAWKVMQWVCQSICPSCFCTSYWTDLWPWLFACMSHDLSFPGIKSQSRRLGSRISISAVVNLPRYVLKGSLF